ncbi:hypothetical protein ABVV53_05310 [Novosphingobium sp. RD2P27]|uniref:Uncharacterized protein n=1 Tax=Novosphingobium kalidii TaxID=3230299 RepID=A0ABV2CZ56_9SPHN
MNGYRYFAIGTILVALMVELFSPEDPSSGPPATASTANAASGSASSGMRIENTPAPVISADRPFPYAPPSQSNGDGYYLAVARTGIYVSKEEATARGREPRVPATPEAVRDMLEERRRRAGPPSP